MTMNHMILEKKLKNPISKRIELVKNRKRKGKYNEDSLQYVAWAQVQV